VTKKLPDAATFSRAFEQFATRGLPERMHATLIASHVGKRIVGHLPS
jgi:hypothetical protein